MKLSRIKVKISPAEGGNNGVGEDMFKGAGGQGQRHTK